jgi:2-oxoglutarate dehydrogenase complex dehydrogenase (E1) component-like enzyme
MTNRVSAMITRQNENLKDRLAKGLTTQSQVDDLHKNLDMDLSEYARFQEIKSLASVEGTLTLEEAQTVYAYLGTTPDHFNEQPKLFSEIISLRMARSR